MIQYGHKRCIDMAEMCSLAYLPECDARQKADELGHSIVRFFNNEASQAYLLSTSYGYVVAFRGTELRETGDIISDIDIDLVPIDDTRSEPKVHHGFLKATNRILEGIVSVLWSIGVTEVTLTGHSLGAALATISASIMSKNGFDIKEVWTFGSPAVGDMDFAAEFAGSGLWVKTFRVVNNNDIVPVALESPPLPHDWFEHVGRFLYIKETGGYPVEDPAYWSVALDKAMGVLLDVGVAGIDGLKDHSIDSEHDGYLYSLKKGMCGDVDT